MEQNQSDGLEGIEKDNPECKVRKEDSNKETRIFTCEQCVSAIGTGGRCRKKEQRDRRE